MKAVGGWKPGRSPQTSEKAGADYDCPSLKLRVTGWLLIIFEDERQIDLGIYNGTPDFAAVGVVSGAQKETIVKDGHIPHTLVIAVPKATSSYLAPSRAIGGAPDLNTSHTIVCQDVELIIEAYHSNTSDRKIGVNEAK